MRGGYLSPEEAAKLRLESFFDAISREGNRRIPLDPRCQSCEGNAIDVGSPGPIEFAQRHRRPPQRLSYLYGNGTYSSLSVWHSHVCPLEGESTLQRNNNGKKVLPKWITPTTPYFIYSRKEVPDHFDNNPLILRVFIRPCSLCGATDPFSYIAVYLSLIHI